jgi:glycine cleavage system regulatory protein
MNINEFESQYRAAMDETLNELQTAVLLLVQVQRQISQIGNHVHHLSEQVEDFINAQKVEN